MTGVHVVLGVALTALFAAAGLLGAWRWYRVETSRWFWRLLRAAQALLIVQIALGGLLLAVGERADRELHLLYGLLPLAVSFVAEQLRLAAAQTVLDGRGLPDAEAVGRLPEADQRSVVTAILRRELGATAAGALVATGLALRAGWL